MAVTGDQTTIADLSSCRRRDVAPVNTPPIAVITPNGATAPEGSRLDFSAASSSDPDGDTITFAWDLDANGSVDGTATTFSLQAGTPGPRVVKLTVADGRGGATSTQVTATFTNVAPTVVAGGDITIGPDGVFERTGRFEDPGEGDTFTATVDWGDGSGFVPLPRFARTLDLGHTYAAIGSYPVVVRVCDAGRACGEGAFTVTVASEPPPNLPPVARIDGPLEALEGETVSYDAAASTDPEGRSLVFAWDLDADGVLDDGSGPGVSLNAGGPGTRTIVVGVTDPAGATTLASVQLNVRNAAPSLDAIADQRVDAGMSLRLDAVVRDAAMAPDGYRATVDWGDGAGPITAPFATGPTALRASGVELLDAAGLSAVGTVELVHTYVADGEYRVVVTVCDSSCTDVTFLTVVTAGAPVATVPTTPPTPTASPSDRLPETGSSSRPTLQLSLALLGLGVCLVLVTRRRRTTG